ncbi:hypothetical protein [Zooshikella ganghwensis]|uniref:hypothetical protein n=1 Tax=Zooshikella ganghwensis TaxID=202772 RepID=UPI000422AA56|nr:hypothetical protein [Zooshikella ganghwensis]
MQKAVLALDSNFVALAFTAVSLNSFADEKGRLYLSLGANAAEYNNSHSDYENENDPYSGNAECTKR